MNPTHNEKYSEKRGFFGFFESIDDQEVANGLFDTVRAWLQEQGITDLRGPVNPSLNYEIGLLIDGFDSPPTFMMTHNLPVLCSADRELWFWKSPRRSMRFGDMPRCCRHLDKKLEFIIHEATRRFDIKLRYPRSIAVSRRGPDVSAYLQCVAGGDLGIHSAIAGRDRPHECGDCGTWWCQN